ncbi:MAG: sulfatase-like hydrolase/transferase [Acidobacteriota bacterium]|nr:sulfatase-like hydrolase/transferase [Acidobacteriota bacterium]
MKSILFLFIICLTVLPGCRTDKADGEDFTSWRAASEIINIPKKTGQSNHLDNILFLDDFFGNFDKIRIEHRLVHEIYELPLPAIEVKQGSAKQRRGTLKISGEDIVLQLALDNDLMTSRKLNLLELDLDSRDDLDIKVFMTPKGREEATDLQGGVGIFVHEFFSPGGTGKADRIMTLNLTQRFGLYPLPMGRLTIKIAGAEQDRRAVTLRLNGVRLLSPNVYFTRTAPVLDYHRYGGADRRRLKSVFFPAGTEATYTLVPNPEREEEPVVIDGYLGSVDGRDVGFEIRINEDVLVSGKAGSDIEHFREVIPSARAAGPLVMTIRVTGESGQVGFLGNMSVYHPWKERRNVVLYLIDALRADMGGIQTPLFEEFNAGAVFSNAYANATATADSLPSLFTGKYKFTLVEKPADNPFISNKETLLAEYFKRKGYMTVAFINNPWLDLSNASRGFDQIYFCWNPLENAKISPSSTPWNPMFPTIRLSKTGCFQRGPLRKSWSGFSDISRKLPTAPLSKTRRTKS